MKKLFLLAALILLFSHEDAYGYRLVCVTLEGSKVEIIHTNPDGSGMQVLAKSALVVDAPTPENEHTIGQEKIEAGLVIVSVKGPCFSGDMRLQTTLAEAGKIKEMRNTGLITFVSNSG